VVAEIDPGGDLIILTAGVTSPFAVVKLDHATGSPLWSYEVPDTVGGVQLAVDSSGDVAVHHWATAGTVLRKLDGGSGVPIWGPVPTGPPGSPGDLAFAPDGSILLVSSIIPPQLVQRRSGADGSLIWEAEVGSGDHLAVDGSGDVFLLGQQGASSLLSKYAGSSGALLWGPVVQDDPLWGELMVTPQGDPIVGGQGVGGASAVKYDGATGALLWGPIGPGAGTYYYQGLVVDPSGDVFLTGTAADPTFADIVAARLSGVDGSFVWGPLTYDGGENEQALAAGLDPLGNLVVGGVTAPTYLSLGHRSLILGYDAETGSMLWDPLFGETPYASVQFVRSGDGLLYTIDRISRPEGTAVRAFTFALGVETPPDDFLVDCGDFLSLQLEAGNEVGVVVWSLEAGTLPAGVTLTSGGLLSGTPMEVGDFPIRVRVEDSTMAFATRDLTIVVGFGDPIPIVATPLSSCQVLLQVPGSWDNYRWEPGGEATPFIVVSPFHDTVYGVTVSDVSGCPMRETVLVRATRLVDPSCDAPSIFLMSPTSGPASGGTLVGLNGTQFQIGATVRIGGLDADASISSPGSGSATTPALQPGALHTVLLTNPDAASAFSPIRFFADFLDVGQGHLFHDFVESIVRAGVTAGCGEGNYCPDAVVRRDQIAVFLLRSRYGPTYEPPPATGTVFGDVNIGTFAGNYIEALAAAGVTAGCGGGNYCPADPVTREQVAVFLLRTLEGPTYVPPPCTSPTFSDVPCSSGFAAWIEELVTRGITAGCGGGLYCPLLEVTRGQMAVFLTETFGL
jgi:outer membrane protein assembly factor BamB